MTRLLTLFLIINLGGLTIARLEHGSYSRLRSSQAAVDIASSQKLPCETMITMSSSELFTPEERSLLLIQSMSLSYIPTFSPLNRPAASPSQFGDESKPFIPNPVPTMLSKAPIKKGAAVGPSPSQSLGESKSSVPSLGPTKARTPTKLTEMYGIPVITSTSTPSVTASPENMETYSATGSSNLTISGSILGGVPDTSSTSFFNISDCGSYSVEWLIDLAETCHSTSVNVTNITSLEGCVCNSANMRFAAGDISCNQTCPTSCETCDACFQLYCSEQNR